MKEVDEMYAPPKKQVSDSNPPQNLWDKYPRDQVYFDVQNEMRKDMTRFANTVADWNNGQQDAAAMRQEPSLYGFKWNDALWLAAKDHCLEQASRRSFSHFGGDGSKPDHRINRYSSDGREFAV